MFQGQSPCFGNTFFISRTVPAHLGHDSLFMFGFPIAPEAAPPKVIPLIPLDGCSLSGPSQERSFSSALRGWMPG